MSRWRVKAARSTVHNAALWWEAYDSEGKDWEAFRTHAEALAYADRKARTREYVLPRVGDATRLAAHNDIPGGHPSGYHIFTSGPEYHYAVRILGPWGSMGIYKAQDIRPLALALLAHAERIGE